MTEQHLYSANISSSLVAYRGKAMPERVECKPFWQVWFYDFREPFRIDVASSLLAGESPPGRPGIYLDIHGKLIGEWY